MDRPEGQAERPEPSQEKGNRDEMPPTIAGAGEETLVPFSTRVRESTRRRARIYAAANDLDIQTVVEDALDAYLKARGV